MRTITNPPVKSIDQQQLRFKMLRPETIEIINVLSPGFYGLGLIKDSKKIPLSELEMRLAEIDKNKEVITYCAGYESSASRQAAELLQSRGFRAKAYEGGIKEWKKLNFPTE